MLISRNRTVATTDAVLAHANTQAVRAVLEPILDPDAVLCSDSSAVSVALAMQLYIPINPLISARVFGLWTMPSISRTSMPTIAA